MQKKRKTNKIITATLLKGFTSNGNYYPPYVVEEAIKEYKSQIKSKKSLGMYQSLDELSSSGDLKMSDVSHLVRNVKVDEKNNCVKAKIEILSTPKGNKIKEDMLKDPSVVLFTTVFSGNIIGKKAQNLTLLSIDAINVSDISSVISPLRK